MPDPTAWAAFAAPALGQAYTDALYGCPVKRLTDSAAHGSAQHHFHPALSPMNLGDTMIFVNDDTGAWSIIDLDGNVLVPAAAMPPRPNADHFVWDRQDPNSFWRTAGNQLEKCTVAGGSASCATNHTFTEYPYAVAFPGPPGGGQPHGDAADMSPDGWLAMLGQNTQGAQADIFTFNPAGSGQKSAAYSTSCTGDVLAGFGCIYGALATPNDGVLIHFSTDGTGAEQGLRLWEAPWTLPLPQVQNSTSHLDVGRDLAGNEVFAAEADPDDPTGCDYSPDVQMLVGTPPSCLFSTSPPLAGWFASYRDWPAAAWIAYSPEGDSPAELFGNDPGYAPPALANWNDYDGEIVLARVDASEDSSKVYRLALTHTRDNSAYGDIWFDPRAALSWDGKYVIFDSNAAYGATGCGTASDGGAALPDCSDVYLIQIH